MAEKPYTMRFVDAVCASNLPSDIRHLLMVMAYKADNETGKGFSGQETIAKAAGFRDREVRRKLERLEALADAPVAVLRRPRFAPNGNRTSDEYHLVFRDHRSQTTTGRERPPVPSDTTTGRLRQSPPVVGDQGSSQRILSGDPLSSLVRSAHVPKPRKAKAVSPKRTKPEHTDEQRAAHAALTEHYFADFERLRGSKPIGWGAREGRAVHDLLGKVSYELAAAKRIVTSGLQSWAQATIMDIAANPSRYVAGGHQARPPQSARNGDLIDYQLRRSQELEAAERKERALP